MEIAVILKDLGTCQDFPSWIIIANKLNSVLNLANYSFQDRATQVTEEALNKV